MEVQKTAMAMGVVAILRMRMRMRTAMEPQGHRRELDWTTQRNASAATLAATADLRVLFLYVVHTSLHI